MFISFPFCDGIELELDFDSFTFAITFSLTFISLLSAADA